MTENVYGAHSIAPSEPVINPTQLGHWAYKVEAALNNTIIKVDKMDMDVHSVEVRMKKLERMYGNLQAFAEFVQNVHPEIIKEFHRNQDATERLTE